MKRNIVQSTNKCFFCSHSFFEQNIHDRKPVLVCKHRAATEKGYLCPAFNRTNYKSVLREGAKANKPFMLKMKRIHDAIDERIAREGESWFNV